MIQLTLPPTRGTWRAPPLSDLEIAVGEPLQLRPEDGAEPIDLRPHDPGPSVSARQAMEAAVLAGLCRPPCGVAFSGGCDSSAILAVAAHVARREGLPPPIPLTYQFPRLAVKHETDWQELVVDHLGLTDWRTVAIDDELDLIGPLAAAAHDRFGLLWPPAIHMLLPLMAEVAGGSLLTGEGGDELTRLWVYHHLANSLRGQHRASLQDVKRVIRIVGGRGLRRAVQLRKYDGNPRWLTAAAHHDHARALADYWSSEPSRWDTYLGWTVRPTRAKKVFDATLSGLGAGFDVVHREPFKDLAFLAALARTHGRFGYRSRPEAMAELVGDLLPAAVLERSTKMEFTPVYFNRHCRAFAEGWTGQGVNPEVVDAGRLRKAWLDPRTGTGAWSVIQAARLATRRE